jgi:predicted HAD superfamily phosphohydrolase YqeG
VNLDLESAALKAQIEELKRACQLLMIEMHTLKSLCARAADTLEVHLGYERERPLVEELRKATNQLNEPVYPYGPHGPGQPKFPV